MLGKGRFAMIQLSIRSSFWQGNLINSMEKRSYRRMCTHLDGKNLIDGSAAIRNNTSGWGFVIRDENGEVMGAGSVILHMYMMLYMQRR
jgi:hypothetical protein